MTTKPRMFYFGPWDQAGHYFHGPGGSSVDRATEQLLPWGPSGGWKIDGGLCPPQSFGEGRTRLHQKDGWTIIAFWDMTVDTRPGSNSAYLAEGTFTFEEMVEMAKTRFAPRWNKMGFEVSLVGAPDGQ